VALTNGFQFAFLIAGIFAAIGAAVALFGMPKVRMRGQEQPADDTPERRRVREREPVVAGG
jgi:hypothetical protein